MTITQDITLDFSRATVYGCRVQAKQGDKDSRKLKVHFTDNGVAYKAPSGATAAYRVKKPDGHIVDKPATVNSDGTVTVTLSDQALAVAGTCLADVVLKEAGTILSSASFTLLVGAVPYGDALPSNNEFVLLTTSAATAKEAAERAEVAAEQAEAASQATIDALKSVSGPTNLFNVHGKFELLNIFDATHNQETAGQRVPHRDSVTGFGYGQGIGLDYIPCKPSTQYYYSEWQDSGIFGDQSAVYFYDENKRWIWVGEKVGRVYLQNHSGVFTTPSKCKYMRIQFNIRNFRKLQIVEGTTAAPYQAKVEKKEFSAMPVKPFTKSAKVLGSAATSATLTLDNPCTYWGNEHGKFNNTISFHAKVGSFNRLEIGRGFNTQYDSTSVIIDRENVVVKWGALEKSTAAHNLTISGYITVIIHVKYNYKADLTILSNAQKYTAEIDWMGDRKDIKAISTNSALTDASLSYCDNDLQKPIWVMGDSYLDFWPLELNSAGYTENVHYSGYGGRPSEEALWELLNLLDNNDPYAELEKYRHGTICSAPVILVWAMGMNDADGAEINAKWLEKFQCVEAVCLNKNIELVPCTIPTTPKVNNNFKNAYIRDSGYRIIDIAKAVGSSGSGSWYPGLIGSDSIHPSAEGRSAIAYAFLHGLPEIGYKID